MYLCWQCIPWNKLKVRGRCITLWPVVEPIHSGALSSMCSAQLALTSASHSLSLPLSTTHQCKQLQQLGKMTKIKPHSANLKPLPALSAPKSVPSPRHIIPSLLVPPLPSILALAVCCLLPQPPLQTGSFSSPFYPLHPELNFIKWKQWRPI